MVNNLIELKQEFPEVTRFVDAIADDLPDDPWTIAGIARLLNLGKKTVGYHFLHNMESIQVHGPTGDYWIATTEQLQRWAIEYLPGIISRKRAKDRRIAESTYHHA